MQWLGSFFHAENNQAVLAFPTFTCTLDVHDELEAPIQRVTTQIKLDFDEAVAAPLPSHSGTLTIPLVTEKVTQYLQQPHHQEPFSHTVQVKKMAPEAKLPTKGTPG